MACKKWPGDGYHVPGSIPRSFFRGIKVCLRHGKGNLKQKQPFLVPIITIFLKKMDLFSYRKLMQG